MEINPRYTVTIRATSAKNNHTNNYNQNKHTLVWHHNLGSNPITMLVANHYRLAVFWLLTSTYTKNIFEWPNIWMKMLLLPSNQHLSDWAAIFSKIWVNIFLRPGFVCPITFVMWTSIIKYICALITFFLEGHTSVNLSICKYC